MSERSSADIAVDPAELWDRYCEETPAFGRTPQNAMAFTVDAIGVPAAHATLKARIEELETALKPFADISLVRDTDPNGMDMIDAPDLAITPNDVRRTRAVLASKGGVK